MQYAHTTPVWIQFALCLFILSVSRSAALPAHALSERYASGDGSDLSAPQCNCKVTNGSLVDEKCEGDTPPVPVTHTDAFGGSNGAIQTCLNELTEPNKRVCYRTLLTMCSDTFSLETLLKKRNPDNDNVIRERCKNIDDYSMLDELQTLNERMYIRSPRYECQKKYKNGAWSEAGVYNYRHNELCLYDVSMMQCESGMVKLKSNHQSLQPADNSGSCVDYVEVRHALGGAERFCGSEGWERVIPSDFIITFWSADKNQGDYSSGNYKGFELVAECFTPPPLD